MTTIIYDKTDKGREEIATRCHGLALRLRTLLLLMDGKQPVDAVLAKVTGLGLGIEHVAQLCEAGYLQQLEIVTEPEPALLLVSTQTEADLETEAMTVQPVFTATAEAAASDEADSARAETEHPEASASLAAAPTPADEAAEEPLLLPELAPDLPPLQAIYQFYTDTIRSTIGLRGYSLQLKVEQAVTMDDFRRLRASYLDAMQAAKGQHFALALQPYLDSLLAADNPLPNAA